MSLYALKPRFQALLRPAARALHGLGLSANQVTAGTCAASLLLGGGLALAAHSGHLQWFLLLPLWFLLRMALNAIDGMLAREFGQASTLGAYLNELSDPLSDAALYLPFAFLPEVGTALTVEARTLAADKHSGVFGGAAPDALLALIRALSTLHDARGDVAVAGLNREPWTGATYTDEEFRKLGEVLPDAPLMGSGTLGERIWSGPAARRPQKTTTASSTR